MYRIIHLFLAACILCAVTIDRGAGMASGQPTAPAPTVSSSNQHLAWVRLEFPKLPPPRFEFSLALNSTDQQAYLFGGANSSTGLLNDLWSFDGTAWTQLQPSQNPTARVGANLVYDQARQELILFGGGNSSELFGNTWKYIPYDWVQQYPQTSPTPRMGAGMAYDAARNQTVLFGGENGTDQDNWLNDTWTWDGANWQLQHPSAAPYQRGGAAMVYDGARQNIVLFSGGVGGGILDDTWIWDGTNWIEQHPAHSPFGRSDAGMAYDPGRQQVILYGGAGPETDTWAWDGLDWAQLPTFQNPPEGIGSNAQLVYLPALHTTLLIGDYTQKFCDANPCFSEETQVWALESLSLSYLPVILK